MFILVIITLTARYLHPGKGFFRDILEGWMCDTSLTCLWSPVQGTKAPMTLTGICLEDMKYSNEMLTERDFVMLDV